jgi:hypothetical protein
MPHERRGIPEVAGADPTLALESVVPDRTVAAPSQVGSEASSTFRASPALQQVSFIAFTIPHVADFVDEASLFKLTN